MPNKKKEIISTNLAILREKLGYTQKDLADILSVDVKMIRNYEEDISNLPIDKAIFLSKKYNFSLDWIYKNTQNNSEIQYLKNYSEEERTNFLVDIRDFVIFSDNKIKLRINNSYWEYIKKLNEIKHSDKTQRRQKSEIAELNGSYKMNDNSYITWEFSIDIDKFKSIIFDSCVFACDNSTNMSKPSEEDIKNAENFIQSLVRESAK